jgi:hypothetical protein
MDIFHPYTKLKRSHFISGISWLFWAWIGSLLPSWGLLVILLLYAQKINLNVFTQNGEFALYSAATLSASIYIITKEDSKGLLTKIVNVLQKKEKWKNIKSSFPGMNVFLGISVLLLVLSTLLFSGATFIRLPGSTLKINLVFLQFTSIAIFIISNLIGYIIAVIDNSISETTEEDYHAILDAPVEKLMTQFDKLRKGK